MNRIAHRWLPPARVKHPFPDARFHVRTQDRGPVREQRTLGSARGAARKGGPYRDRRYVGQVAVVRWFPVSTGTGRT
jgi:hypothetical protein